MITTSIHRLTACWLIVAVASLLLPATPAGAAESHHSVEYGYTIDVPDGWQLIPPDAVAATTSLIRKPGSSTALVYDLGMQRSADKQWFTYPYVMVMVIPYRAFGATRQINEDEFPKVVSAISGANIKKVTDEQMSDQAKSLVKGMQLGQAALDAPHHRFQLPVDSQVKGIGTVRGLMTGYFGREALVQVAAYCRDRDFEAQSPTLRSISNSFHFDPDKDYSPALAAATRRPNILENATRMGVVGGLVGGTIGLLVYLAMKAGKSRQGT